MEAKEARSMLCKASVGENAAARPQTIVAQRRIVLLACTAAWRSNASGTNVLAPMAHSSIDEEFAAHYNMHM